MKHTAPNLEKPEDNLLWQEANSLAEYMYLKLPEFPADEHWETERKLRATANELIYTVAVALGNSGPMGHEYEWSNVRKQAVALKTMYRFAGRQKFIELDPDIMLRLDKFIRSLDKVVMHAYQQSADHYEAEYKKDLAPWLEKYNIWKQLQREQP